jgi:ABC-type amino acid transport system permease subunit
MFYGSVATFFHIYVRENVRKARAETSVGKNPQYRTVHLIIMCMVHMMVRIIVETTFENHQNMQISRV